MYIRTACCQMDLTRPDNWPDHIEGATWDCPNNECQALLIFLDNDGTNQEFHKYMHEKSLAAQERVRAEKGDETAKDVFVWPEDGNNTFYMDTESGEVHPT